MTRILLALVLLLSPGALLGQDTGGPVTLAVDSATGALSVTLRGALDEEGLRDALHSGLPIRVLVVAELWKDRFFDSQEGRAEWRASVVYDPLERSYQVGTSEGSEGVLGEVNIVESLDEVEIHLRENFVLPLQPESEGGFYYMTVVEVQTLSLSDLEELERWLRGDLGRAVSGEGDVEGAVGRGVRRIMVRMLGLPARRLRVRTDVFRFDPASGVQRSGGTDPSS